MRSIEVEVDAKTVVPGHFFLFVSIDDSAGAVLAAPDFQRLVRPVRRIVLGDDITELALVLGVRLHADKGVVGDHHFTVIPESLAGLGVEPRVKADLFGHGLTGDGAADIELFLTPSWKMTTGMPLAFSMVPFPVRNSLTVFSTSLL
jgi:hypothetical protein